MVTDHEKAAFSARLNQVLDEAGIAPKGQGRQIQVARMFGVSQKGARKWLEGEAIPTTARLTLVTAQLHVSIEWLLTGRGPMRPPVERNEGPQGQSSEEETVAGMVSRLQRRYQQAEPSVREAVDALLLRCRTNPAEARRVARAIQALLGEED